MNLDICLSVRSCLPVISRCDFGMLQAGEQAILGAGASPGAASRQGEEKRSRRGSRRAVMLGEDSQQLKCREWRWLIYRPGGVGLAEHCSAEEPHATERTP